VIPDHLRIQPGQQALTPEQEAEAKRFAEARIAAQLSTEPVDEVEAEALVRQAYIAAQLPPPTHVHWVDGPLQLVAALVLHQVEEGVHRTMYLVAGLVLPQGWDHLGEGVTERVELSAYHNINNRVKENGVGKGVEDHVSANVWSHIEASVWDHVGEPVWEYAWATLGPFLQDSLYASVNAYFQAPSCAYRRFFDEFLAANELYALTHLNELVSGYWLGAEGAVLVRRPRRLSLDAEGRLHSGTGPCIEYGDGWGFYAWHGVRVPEKVILAPETLTREDFLNEEDVEVRRLIQERMGQRFVQELGGIVLERGPHGTLYEVRLPEDDPEQVARYVQVQDASTERQYFLRVPPTVQTAAEAVAWTFQVAAEDYRPAEES
jgi:hypothetical protein